MIDENVKDCVWSLRKKKEREVLLRIWERKKRKNISCHLLPFIHNREKGFLELKIFNPLRFAFSQKYLIKLLSFLFFSNILFYPILLSSLEDGSEVHGRRLNFVSILLLSRLNFYNLV